MADQQTAAFAGLLEPEVQRQRQGLFAIFEDPAADAADRALAAIDAHGIDVEACDAERLIARNHDTLVSLALRRPDPDMLDVVLLRSPVFKSIEPAAAGAALLAEAARRGACKRVMLKAWRLCQTQDFQDIHGFSPLGRAIERAVLEEDSASAVFLLERGADLEAPAFKELGARELARRLRGPGADLAREMLGAPIEQLANDHLARAADFDRELAEALSAGDVAAAALAADKGGVVRWGPLGSAQEPAAFEAGDAAGEAREILRSMLAQGRADCARFFLLETPISRVELFLEALASGCPSEEVFDLAIGGHNETLFAGPGGSTLLHEAVQRRNLPAIRALLRRGADPDRRDAYQRTPAGMAAEAADAQLGAAFAPPSDSAAPKAPAPGAAPADESPSAAAEAIAVFAPDSIALAESRFAGADAERKRASDRAIARMRKAGGLRIGAAAPAVDAIRALARDYPTFSEVIEMVALRALTTARASERAGRPRAFKLPNILLVGKPGMGKTHFLARLAQVLGAGHQLIQMGATSAGFVLAGMDSGWSGAKPGKVFELLAEGRFANPLLALDEIDKMSSDDKFPVSGPLYALLERGTARTWRDEFVDAPMDASYVNYIATANDASAIDGAILSRFDVYDIPDPDREEAERIARSVYREVLAREGWGDLFDPELSDDALAALASTTPREAAKMLGQALPAACAKGRDRLAASDFKAPPAKRGMGFV